MMKKIYKDISLARNVTMMETGVVYLIPAPFCPISKQIYEEAESAIFEAGLAYDYSMQELSYKDIPVQLRAWKNLLKTTIVLPVFMPDQEEFHYLVAHCKKSDITIIIKQMVTDAESMSKESAKNALINLAYNDPDFFEDMLYEEDLIFDDEGLEDTKEESFFDRAKSVGKKLGYMLSHHIFKAFEPGVTMLDMSSMDDCNDICPTCEDSLNEQIASLKETNELIKRFLHNVKKLKETNDPIAQKEVDWVIENSVGFTDKLWKRIFKECDIQTQKDIFKKFIDRNTLGKKSKIIITIEKTPREEVVRNVGLYRISIRPEGCTNDNRKFLSFKHQATCVVYMMYLIDRKDRKKKVDCLQLTSNMTNFKSLYQYVYGFGSNDIDAEVEKLLVEKPKNSNYYRSGKLRHCYSDISSTFSRELDDIESPVPFMVNRSSHLTIDPEHIIIPDEFKRLHFS